MLSKLIFDKNKVNNIVINKYFLSIIIFISSLTVVSSLLSLAGLTFENSIKLGILTIMNTVNSSLFNVGDFDFYNLNNMSKMIFIIFMIIGRVELITLVILIKKYLFKN